MRDYLRDVLDNWNDHYWRADHPEITALLAALVTGALGLLFVWLELKLRARVQLPDTRDV